MKKYLKIVLLAFILSPLMAYALIPLSPNQGGTGIGTATVGDVGKFLKLSDDSPMTYILDTVSAGVTSLNSLTGAVNIASTETGTDFVVSTSGSTVQLNLPVASATNTGKLSSTDWSTFNNKFNLPALTSGSVLFSDGATIAQDNTNFFWDDTNNRLGVGTASPVSKFHVSGSPGASGNYGTLSLGGGAFDGSTSGFFSGDTDGTSIAVNEVSGYAGNLVDLQVNGSSKFSVSPTGLVVNSAGMYLGGNSIVYGSLELAGSLLTPNNNNTLLLGGFRSFSTNNGIEMGRSIGTTSLFTASSGTQAGVYIQADVNQSGTAGFTDLRVNRTETTLGSGAQYLLDLQVGGTTKFNISNLGDGYFAGSVGIKNASSTAYLHLGAGTATASTAPLKFTSGTNLTTAEAGSMEYDGTNLFFTRAGTVREYVSTGLRASASLDFGNTPAGTSTDLTMTVTGASDGDVCSLGVPNVSTVTDGSFSCWVSAADTVTVRYINNALVIAYDPADGTFKVTVEK